MKREIQLILIIISFGSGLYGQKTANADISKLPINEINSNTDQQKPFILYITGDGGWNKFSQRFAQIMADNGYPIISLNAAKYFWEKKSPEQTASDLSKLIKVYMKQWNRKEVILAGYSFGADVMPFAYTRLPGGIAALVKHVVLLSPSPNADFEIHLIVLLGGKSNGPSVPSEINKITGKSILIVLADDDKDFPLDRLTIKNYSTIKLPGGHHYDGDVISVCTAIARELSGKK
jgi:type IV secretory pathway VirJ component